MKRVSISNTSISASLEKLKNEFSTSNLATEVPGLVSSLQQLSQSNILFTAHLNQLNHTVSTFSKHQDDFLTTLTKEISSLKPQSSSAAAATSDDRTQKLEKEVGELKVMMNEMLGLLKSKVEVADVSATSKGDKITEEGEQTKESQADKVEEVAANVEGERADKEVAEKTAEDVPAGLARIVPKPAEVVPVRPRNVSTFKRTPEFHAALEKRFADKGKAAVKEEELSAKFIGEQIVNEELKGADEETRRLGLEALKKDEDLFFTKKSKTLEESQDAYLDSREIRQRKEEIIKVTPTITQQEIFKLIKDKKTPQYDPLLKTAGEQIKDIRSKERKYRIKDSLLSSARHPYPPPPQQPRSGIKRIVVGHAVSQLAPLYSQGCIASSTFLIKIRKYCIRSSNNQEFVKLIDRELLKPERQNDAELIKAKEECMRE
uniref:uncharacterized protein LOC122610301 n=1 Tax=Erigeron canadensis TaxID=72917 RepID=UPI001CB98B38|nr:uncharacterized protein LOC122610301 [Erigeron canadensis]